MYLLPTPRSVQGETLGPVRAAASSSSRSFLKVLLGMRWSEVIGVWWKSSEGATVADHHRFRQSNSVVISFFSFLFCFFLGVLVLSASAVEPQLYRVVAISI